MGFSWLGVGVGVLIRFFLLDICGTACSVEKIVCYRTVEVLVGLDIRMIETSSR